MERKKFSPNKIGWGLIYCLFPCWIIWDEEFQEYGPMLRGGIIAEFFVGIVTFLYSIVIGLANLFIIDPENKQEVMFVVWVSPKTREKIKQGIK